MGGNFAQLLNIGEDELSQKRPNVVTPYIRATLHETFDCDLNRTHIKSRSRPKSCLGLVPDRRPPPPVIWAMKFYVIPLALLAAQCAGVATAAGTASGPDQ